MSSVLPKLVALSAMASLTIKACTPPNKEKSSDKIERSTFMNKYIHSMTKYLTMPALLLPHFVLYFVLLLKTLSSTPLFSGRFESVCSRDVTHELDRLSPSFWCIFLLIAGGSILRMICYRILGRFFTFEVTIRPNHQIIDYGPYGIVRHPSYTGAFSMWGGTALWVFSPQNPAVACGWAASSLIVKLIMASWSFAATFFLYTLVQRVFAEERNLQIHFGQAWDQYTKRVPYRYLPGVC